jgi:cob(I)alamin adenosyltransferase
MKWINLHSRTGDISEDLTPSKTDFCRERLSKSNKIFEFLGALDMANAIIGNFFADKEVGDYLQSIHRHIMGTVYTGKDKKELERLMEEVDEDLVKILTFLDSHNKEPSGWSNYNSPYDLLCCQIRQAERNWAHIDPYDRILQKLRPDGYRLVANFLNRLSKYYYVKGVLYGKEV